MPVLDVACAVQSVMERPTLQRIIRKIDLRVGPAEMLFEQRTCVQTCGVEIPAAMTFEDQALALIVTVTVAACRIEQSGKPGHLVTEIVGAVVTDNRTDRFLGHRVDEHPVAAVELQPQGVVELVRGVGAQPWNEARGTPLAVHRCRFRHAETLCDPFVDEHVETGGAVRPADRRGQYRAVADALHDELFTFYVQRMEREAQPSIVTCDVCHDTQSADIGGRSIRRRVVKAAVRPLSRRSS